MSLDKEKTAPETSEKKSGTENIKNIAKQDILDLSNDEHLKNMKERYGKGVESFVKGIRTSDEYGHKCRGMSDYEVLEFGKSEPGLKEYHKQYIDKIPKNMENYDAVSNIESNERGSFSQKEYTRLRKEKGQEAAARYAQQWKVTKKPEEKEEKIDNKSEKKTETGEEKPKEQETPKQKKDETPKEPTPPVEKSESKPEGKKTEEKKEKKKNFRSGRFTKKEKSDKKSETLSKIGSAITYVPKQVWKGSKALGNATRKGVKAIPHQTWNLVSYAPRVARSSVKYVGFDWINHGLNKPGLKKNRDNYASKWKREQGGKK